MMIMGGGPPQSAARTGSTRLGVSSADACRDVLGPVFVTGLDGEATLVPVVRYWRALSIGEHPYVADAVKPFGKHLRQEAGE